MLSALLTKKGKCLAKSKLSSSYEIKDIKEVKY